MGLIDILPTLCEAAGIEVPECCEGLSLQPVLGGRGSLDRDYLFGESALLGRPEHAGCMVRHERWKYNYYLDGAEELYDLSRDPDEWHNLAQDPQHTGLDNGSDTGGGPDAGLVERLRQEAIRFWKPDEQQSRFERTPVMQREKHFYPYSNQFVLGEGVVVDGRP